MTNGEAFLKQFVDDVPELHPLYTEHRREFNEVLTHILMADITRVVLDLVGRANARSNDAERQLTAILSRFEEGMRSGDDEIENIITLSFLENLESGDPAAEALRPRLGPNLSAQLRTMRRG